MAWARISRSLELCPYSQIFQFKYSWNFPWQIERFPLFRERAAYWLIGKLLWQIFIDVDVHKSVENKKNVAMGGDIPFQPVGTKKSWRPPKF